MVVFIQVILISIYCIELQIFVTCFCSVFDCLDDVDLLFNILFSLQIGISVKENVVLGRFNQIFESEVIRFFQSEFFLLLKKLIDFVRFQVIMQIVLNEELSQLKIQFSYKFISLHMIF